MGKLTIICAWCNKVLSSSKEPSIQSDMTSHGMCPKCADKQRKDAQEYVKAMGGKK
jgi:phage FluMu protein Com